jgi:CRP-like cAMP-binding protein
MGLSSNDAGVGWSWHGQELIMEPERLSSFTLFDGLSADELAACAAPFQEIVVLSDHNVAREGDAAYAFFIVLEGELDVHHDFQRIRTLGPGDFFGEIGLETSGTRSAHVAARGRVKLAKLMAWDYRAMVERHPMIRDRIAAVIAERSERP